MTLAMAVHPRVTYRSDRPGPVATPPTPAGMLSYRVTDFFARVAGAFARAGQREGTVLLHRDQWLALGFPDELAGQDSPWLDPVRAAGWQVSPRPYATMTAYGHPTLPDVHFGPLHWITGRARSSYPLISDDIPATLGLMAAWQHHSGVAYRGTPGLLGVSILRHTHLKVRGQKDEPRWHPRYPLDPDDPGEEGRPRRRLIPYTCELPYNLRQWHAPELDDEWEPGAPLAAVEVDVIDVNRAYAAAYNSVLVARWGLKHTGKIAFDHLAAGYWLVDLAPWGDPRLPHPAGYGGTGERRWLTTPTLAALNQLTAAGVYAGYTIVDSYTAHGYANVLAPMGRVLSGLMYAEGIAPPLAALAKTVSQQVYGQFVTRSGLVHRPDWWSAVVAHARTLLWLRAWRASRQHGDANPMPLGFKTDAVYYRSGQLPDETHFPRSEKIGKFDPRKIRTLGKGVAA